MEENNIETNVKKKNNVVLYIIIVVIIIIIGLLIGFGIKYFNNRNNQKENLNNKETAKNVDIFCDNSYYLMGSIKCGLEKESNSFEKFGNYKCNNNCENIKVYDINKSTKDILIQEDGKVYYQNMNTKKQIEINNGGYNYNFFKYNGQIYSIGISEEKNNENVCKIYDIEKKSILKELTGGCSEIIPYKDGVAYVTIGKDYYYYFYSQNDFKLLLKKYNVANINYYKVDNEYMYSIDGTLLNNNLEKIDKLDFGNYGFTNNNLIIIKNNQYYKLDLTGKTVYTSPNYDKKIYFVYESNSGYIAEYFIIDDNHNIMLYDLEGNVVKNLYTSKETEEFRVAILDNNKITLYFNDESLSEDDYQSFLVERAAVSANIDYEFNIN